MQAMKDIILDNICKSFGDHAVIKDFSHVFRAGTLTCIEGASGSGKTTLLNIIAGLTEPDSGTLILPEKTAYVFQEDRLCEDFSAVSNIRLVCKNKSDSEIREHLNSLGLYETKKPVRDYSGGMKRRVAIARAICYDADCLLLDEPFKGLDGETKKTAMDYVLKHTKDKTVICVTHDPSEAGYLGGETVYF